MKTLSILAAGLSLGLALWAQSDQKSEPVKGDAAAGETVFEMKCADCHDSHSDETKVGPGLKGVKNGKLPSGKTSTRENILEIIMEGRDEMPSFADSLNAKQKEDVIAYVMTL